MSDVPNRRVRRSVPCAAPRAVQHPLRRLLIGAAALAPAWVVAPAWMLGPARRAWSAPPVFAQVQPDTPIVFPRDFGAHPAFRTEWWYITGWLTRPGQGPCGFQVTFFRSRTSHDDANPSRFAPKQILSAHAAVSAPERGHLVHAQRVARAGLGLAWAREDDTDVAIEDWSLKRVGDRYEVAVAASELSMQLTITPTMRPVLQGDAGFSRKGPRPEQASHYYSEPQLRVDGRIGIEHGTRGTSVPVTGSAWLDHEWSSTILDPAANGWGWIGINLHDGGSLMAFRIRSRTGEALWSHASWTDSAGVPVVRGESRWRALRWWRSARSAANYPIAAEVAIGGASIELQPLMDDQEIDSRASTGTVYWEGAVRAFHQGREIGRGYLELTGYAGALKL